MISLSALKDHLRIEIEEDDAVLARMTVAATAHAQRVTGWYLGAPKEITLKTFGSGTKELFLPQPATDVTVEGMEAEDLKVDGAALTLTNGGRWSQWMSYTITYTAGYDEDEGPQDIVQAVALIVGGWYENREGWIAGTTITPAPNHAMQLLSPYQRVRT
jgi:uncharacterized phiE125 gp8 family phage protein